MAIESIENYLISTFAILIILIPIVTGIILIALRYYEVKNKRNISKTPKYTIIGVISIGLVLALDFILLIFYFLDPGSDIHSLKSVELMIEMIPGTNFHWTVLVDPLSLIMSFLLSIIAFLIHYYAWDYMKHEKEITRFYSFLNFFTGSMFGFVLSGNLFQSFIFWELLGVSSYLLISYYWHKPNAVKGGTKALLYNKLGDIAFMIAIFLVYIHPDNTLKTLDYVALSNLGIPAQELILPGLLLLGGAIGKSAQFPLLGWLPEAMEGPTPVSALLHSSTMVKAGLFLLMRNFTVFFNVGDHIASLSLDGGLVVSFVLWIATITALMGAIFASFAVDFKKILAFSTISQLGYIGMAIGAGGLGASFFHLISHATFKSLLFLCAGAVIHNTQNTKDIRKMGGLWRYMKLTGLASLIGLLGLSGFPFLVSGFFSKDAVLLSVFESEVPGAIIAYSIGLITAILTAFYSTRLLIEVFFGKNKDGQPKKFPDNVHPHPTSKTMIIPMLILAGLVVVQSLYWAFTTIYSSLVPSDDVIVNLMFTEHWLSEIFGVHAHSFNWLIASLSALAGVIGISVALIAYQFFPEIRSSLYKITKKIEPIVINRFGLDIGINWLANNIALQKVAPLLSRVDTEIIDRQIIDRFVVEGTFTSAEIADEFDQKIVDGTVNSIWRLDLKIGKLIRKLQTGLIPNYAKFMGISLIGLLFIGSLIFWTSLLFS